MRIRCRTIVEHFVIFSIHMDRQANKEVHMETKEKNEDSIFYIRSELAWSIRFLLQA